MTFRLPSEEEPPLGKMLLLLSWSGGVSLGRWSQEEPELAWAPLPDVPEHIRETLSRRWIKRQ